MDLFEYFSQNQLASSVKDKTYKRIIDHLDEFVQNIHEEDKQLLFQIISKCYFKYQDSIIKDNEKSIFEIDINLLMAMLMYQKSQYNKL